MTDPRHAGAPGDPDAERVLSQALQAMAGGQNNRGMAPASGPSPETHWSTVQVILLAALIGLTVGVTAGIISLLV